MPKKSVKKKGEKSHQYARKAVFAFLAVILAAVFLSLISGAARFVFDNAPGKSYTITGMCDLGEDSIDCCETACMRWCAAKGKKLIEVGVASPMETKCVCQCTI